MVRQPVESCRAENTLEGSPEWQVCQVRGNKGDVLSKARPQVLAGSLQHVLRKINAYHLPVRQKL